jgi:uncharacterized protein
VTEKTIDKFIDNTIADWTARLERIATAELGDDGSHDLFHFKRVFAVASAIANKEGAEADRLVLLAAAYLHDIVNPPKDSPLRSKASTLSAERAGDILRQEDFPADKIAAAQHAIAAHSFSAGITPESLEAKILQDADRMEALGAIGLARTFYVGGRLKSSLFDPEDPLATDRDLDDAKYAVDHFQAKLFKLPALMNTNEGRRIAEKRAAFLQQFLDQLLSELEV